MVIGIGFSGRRDHSGGGRAATPRGHRRRASPAPQGFAEAGADYPTLRTQASRGKVGRLWGNPDGSRNRFQNNFPKNGKAVGSTRWTRRVRQARRLLCQLAVQGRDHSGAKVAPFVGVRSSAVNRLAESPEPQISGNPESAVEPTSLFLERDTRRALRFHTRTAPTARTPLVPSGREFHPASAPGWLCPGRRSGRSGWRCPPSVGRRRTCIPH